MLTPVTIRPISSPGVLYLNTMLLVIPPDTLTAMNPISTFSISTG